MVMMDQTPPDSHRVLPLYAPPRCPGRSPRDGVRERFVACYAIPKLSGSRSSCVIPSPIDRRKARRFS